MSKLGRIFPVGPAVRFLLAVMLAGAAALLILRLLPNRLSVRTDIVGYPIHQNFNVDRYFQVFNLIAIFIPLATLASYEVLTRIHRHVTSNSPISPIGRGARTIARPPMQPPTTRHKTVGVQLGRSLLVGLVFGIEIATIGRRDPRSFWVIASALAGAYATLAVTAAHISSKRGLTSLSFWDRHASINALMTPLGVAGLYGVSRITEVKVGPGAITRYPWMPLWLATCVTVGLLIWTWIRVLKASKGELDARRVERQILLLVAIPLLLYLLIAGLPGALGPMDVFHEGEALAGTYLTLLGRFPWRDLYFVHGPFQDVLSAFAGFAVFEESRWGYHAGLVMLLFPAVWVSFFFLHAYLFRQNWIFLATTVTLSILLAHLGFVLHLRFILLPPALLLFIALLRKATLWRGLGLGILLTAQAILTPETIPAVVSLGVTLSIFEFYYRDRSARARQSFQRTVWLLAGGGLSTLVWFGYLLSQGALDDFYNYFRNFVPGHLLVGGIPLQVTDRFFIFAAIAPVASLLAGFWYLAYKFKRSRPLSVEDWAMAALGLSMFFYYRKFLSRADAHVFQVLFTALPLVYYSAYKVISAGEDTFRRLRIGKIITRATTYHPLSLLFLGAVTLFIPSSQTELLHGLSNRFVAQAPEYPWLDRLGYSTPQTLDQGLFQDLKAVLAETRNPSGHLFDFTNGPGLFHYLLGHEPSTRYYHVSMAVRRRTQIDLLAELRNIPPEVIVFDGPLGLPEWDLISNMVRHYEISDFILDHYRPFAVLHGYLLMIRNDLKLEPNWDQNLSLGESLVTDDLYFRGRRCDWGYAPNFLKQGPRRIDQGVSLYFNKRDTPENRIDVSLPAALDFADFNWLEIETATAFKQDNLTLSDEIGVPEREITFKTLEGSDNPYRVRVGSCLQWHGYESRTLQIQHEQPQQITGIKLLP